MDFPRLVFKVPGPYQLPGGSYDHKLVETAEEWAEAIRGDWYDSVPNAKDKIKVDIPDAPARRGRPPREE
jgi:hypothetical protein